MIGVVDGFLAVKRTMDRPGLVLSVKIKGHHNRAVYGGMVADIDCRFVGLFLIDVFRFGKTKPEDAPNEFVVDISQFHVRADFFLRVSITLILLWHKMSNSSNMIFWKRNRNGICFKQKRHPCQMVAVDAFCFLSGSHPKTSSIPATYRWSFVASMIVTLPSASTSAVAS